MLKSISVFVVLLMLIPIGCASTIETRDGERLKVGSQQFRDYALQVFKRNNSTLTGLFDVLEQADDEDALRLELAEERMIEACETLNSAAAATRDGKQLGAGILRTISSSIRSCDEATYDTDRLIEEISSVPLQSVAEEEAVLENG